MCVNEKDIEEYKCTLPENQIQRSKTNANNSRNIVGVSIPAYVEKQLKNAGHRSTISKIQI